MSLDGRLREGFERSAAAAGEEQVEPILESVVGAARRRARIRHLAIGATAVTFAVVVVAAGPRVLDAVRGSSESQPANQPKPIDQVIGTYAVNIPEDDPNLAGTWTVRLLPSGVMELDPPPGMTVPSGVSFFVNETSFRTNVFGDLCPSGNAPSYEWRGGSATLTFTVIEDNCRLRRTFFTSVPWILRA
jgi:hypothetical protein